MTVAGDSLRRNGTKDGPDAEFARRGTGTVVSVSPPRARGRRRASRTRRRTVVVVVVINLERMDTSQDCHRSPETVPQVFGERPIDQANQPLSYTEKKVGFHLAN